MALTRDNELRFEAMRAQHQHRFSQARGTSLTRRVIFAWFHMSRSTVALAADRPGEGFLFALLCLSNLLFFMSWSLKAIVVPHEAGVGIISYEIGALLAVSLIVRTGAIYVFAMVIGALARICGGQASWYETRVAVIWGDFITAPFGVMAALMSVLVTNLAVDFPIFASPWISMPPYWFGLLPFIWYISVGVARVEHFKRVSPIFLIMSLVSLVALVGGMYFHARGMI